MYSDDIKRELENIVRGTLLERKSDYLTATRNYLCASFGTSAKVERNFEHQSKIKKEQAEILKTFAQQKGLWFPNLPNENRYLSEGGEAKIYFDSDNRSVVKLNDAIYYNTWLDYLNSVLIHNLLFTDTAYEMLGFKESNGDLHAIVKQPFIISDQPVNLEDVRELLIYNGFKNTRRNDYYNEELGLILEDIHDENVISHSNKLFFIDTVFYIHVT